MTDFDKPLVSDPTRFVFLQVGMNFLLLEFERKLITGSMVLELFLQKENQSNEFNIGYFKSNFYIINRKMGVLFSLYFRVLLSRRFY